jgi:hypothetical protein
LVESKEFPCKKCNWAFKAVAPDDLHTEPSLERPNSGDIKEQKHTCEKCKTMNIVYWLKPDQGVAIV